TASSPLTPRLSTVMSWPGKRRTSSSASRLGYEAAEVLAPAPKVEDEPSATILIGLPAASRRAIRGSGWSRRTCSMGTAQAGGAGVHAAGRGGRRGGRGRGDHDRRRG